MAALLVTLQFGLQAKRAQIDMLLVLLTTWSLWALLRATLERGTTRMWAIGGFAAGVGTVTKGVGFLPLLLLVPAAMASVAARGRGVRPNLPDLHGSVLLVAGFLAGTAVWLLPLLLTTWRSGDPQLQAYVSELLFRQTAERYVQPWHHHRPSWYYLQVIATLWLPGALLAGWLLPAWWRRWRRGDPRQRLLLGWSLLVLLFFTLSPAKREVYIFPALPALCLAAAPLLPGLLRLRGVRRTLLAYLLALSLLLLVAGVLGSIGLTRWPARLLADPQFALADVGAVWRGFAAIGAAGCMAALLWRGRRLAAALVAFSACLWVGYGLVLMPALNAASSSRGMMEQVAKRIGERAELGMLGWREQQLLQADRPVREFGFERPWQAQWPDAAAWLVQDPQRRWLLVESSRLSHCVDAAQAEVAGRAHRRDWLLLQSAALRADCAFESPPTAQAASDPDDGD